MKIQQNYIDIKKRNISDVFDDDAIKSLIKRVAGENYAEKFIFEKIESDGFDCYEVVDSDDKICIRANTGVSAAVVFNRYLKDVCHYSVGVFSTSGTLPQTPPSVGATIKRKSKFLYRYFFNYCTFSYTYAFDNWADWEKTLDYLLLSGYNLILNPIGIESIWKRILEKLGYKKKDISNFLCGPAFYAWQWMMNMTGWAGGAPENWYDYRAKLSGKINERLQSFGAAPVFSGYVGMVPNDFCKYFPDSKVVGQGYWVGYKRPGFILPNDPNYNKIADLYYNECRKIKGGDKVCFFSADPFHEGGITNGIDMKAYALGNYEKMLEHCENAVWVLQEWLHMQTDIIKNIKDGGILVVSLCADNKPTDSDKEDISPWCYCAVNAFGGQYAMHGAAKEQLLNPFKHLNNNNSKIVGIGYMPEAVNCNELLYEINVENAFGNGFDTVEDFLKVYTKSRYGNSYKDIVEALYKVFLVSFHIDRPLGGESGLCSRPAMDVCRVSAWSTPAKPYLDQTILVDYVKTMFAHYDEMSEFGGYKSDLLESTRQILNNISWYYIERIKESYKAKDINELSHWGKELLSLYDLQSALMACDKNRMLGTWLKKARRFGKTEAEKTYFEWNARTQITCWGDKNAAKFLRDYSAREWHGMLNDYYKPRWERFISRLELSILTGKKLEKIDNYNEEIGFTFEKKQYPSKPYGNLKTAVENILNKVCSEKIEYREYGEKTSTFTENVLKDMDKKQQTYKKSKDLGDQVLFYVDFYYMW